MLSPTAPSVLDPTCPHRSGQRLTRQPDAAPGLLERVDPQRLQAITCLFPTPSGLRFLSRLLAQAQSKPAGGEVEVAVITAQSLRELAHRMGLSYDTTHKYVLLFCALGLLGKQRVGGQVELSVALGHYRPLRSLEALDHLIAWSRPKVRSYATQVRRRYLRLYGPCPQAESPTPPSAESAISELDEAIHRLVQMIEQESSNKRRAMLHTILSHLERVRQRVQQEDGMHAGQTAHEQGATGKSAKTVDSAYKSPETVDSAYKSAKMVDSAPMPQTSNGRLGEQTVDLSYKSAKMVDSAPMPQTSNGRLGEQTVDSAYKSAKMVDSACPLNVNNVNVNTITIKDLLINVNVKDMAVFLQTIFHEEPCKRGYYYQLHKQYARPECWLATTLETLVGMHQSKAVKNAGKYFYDRCVALHQTPTLPASTQALVAQYAHLSYPQVLAALTAPKAAVPAPLSSARRSSQPDQYAVFIEERLAAQQAWYEEYCRQHQQPAGTEPAIAPPAEDSRQSPSQADQYAVFIEERLAAQQAWYEEYCRQQQAAASSTALTSA
jgi:hypothetical protein